VWTKSPTNPFANIDIFRRRRPKSLSLYRFAQHQLRKEPSAPTLADHLTWILQCLLAACRKDRNELLSQHRSHKDWCLSLQQSPTITTTTKGRWSVAPDMIGLMSLALRWPPKHFAVICQSATLEKERNTSLCLEWIQMAMPWGNKCHKQRATHESRVLAREKALDSTVLVRI
jgi:hypothetical protein